MIYFSVGSVPKYISINIPIRVVVVVVFLYVNGGSSLNVLPYIISYNHIIAAVVLPSRSLIAFGGLTVIPGNIIVLNRPISYISSLKWISNIVNIVISIIMMIACGIRHRIFHISTNRQIKSPCISVGGCHLNVFNCNIMRIIGRC